MTIGTSFVFLKSTNKQRCFTLTLLLSLSKVVLDHPEVGRETKPSRSDYGSSLNPPVYEVPTYGRIVPVPFLAN